MIFLPPFLPYLRTRESSVQKMSEEELDSFPEFSAEPVVVIPEAESEELDGSGRLKYSMLSTLSGTRPRKKVRDCER